MPPDQVSAASPMAWLRYAQADLALARVPLPEAGLWETLCFHTQQAAEKAIKAALLSYDVQFPFTHDLNRLVGLLPERIRGDQDVRDCHRLTVYAAATRYPVVEPPITEEEYREAVRLAAAVVAWAERLIARHGDSFHTGGERSGA